jgi:cytidylate kinase
MYRSVAFAALRRGVDPEDLDAVAHVARQADIDVEPGQVLVDGVDASIEIRGPEVTRAVSIVAANPEVREEMRRRQREWAEARGGGVIEGRDIGSVVFPEAVLKVYLTAEETERARRRHRESAELHYDSNSPGLAAAVASEISRRDHADRSRVTAPLVVAEGATVVDTTGRSVDEIVDDLLARLP